MKTPFLRAMLLAGVMAPASFAFSLYDMAPPIGMPESHAITYKAHVKVGYDDNLNSSSYNADGGAFTELGVGAAFSDQESATRIRYNIDLGARLFDNSAERTSRRVFGNCNLASSLSHSFGAGSLYTTNLNARWSADPNFSNGISSAYEQGETVNWSWSHVYSKAIDTRWSWSLNASYYGIVYTDTTWQRDDRQYLSGGLTFSYRYSPLTTYTIGSSYRHDFRESGEDSQNVYLNVGAEHSLSPVSSISGTIGVQCKSVAGETNLYPNIRFAYRREIAEGLSANAYFTLDNENIDTGYTAISMYRSDMTIRSGVNLNYAYTHRVSFQADASVLNRNYSDHTAGKADRTDTIWVLSAGMRYKFTQRLTGSIEYRYTTADQEWGDYDRNRVSTGVSYTF